jgi:hypothetical protein
MNVQSTCFSIGVKKEGSKGSPQNNFAWEENVYSGENNSIFLTQR